MVNSLANRLRSLPRFLRSRFSARSPMPSLCWPVRRSCAGRIRLGRRVRTDMLSLERVGKTYPNGVHALDAITLGVVPGEIVVVIGGATCGQLTMFCSDFRPDTPTQRT